MNTATTYTASEVGFLVRGTILSSSFNGTVSGTADHTGGLVGTNFVGTIRYSHVSGAVTTTGGYASKVGGLAGSNSGVIYASYADNDVTGGSYWVGGLVGYNSFEGSTAYYSITDSYWSTRAPVKRPRPSASAPTTGTTTQWTRAR